METLNYDYIVNMVRNASYKVLGKQSGKVTRNGYIYKEM
jgi:hypothetical protein